MRYDILRIVEVGTGLFGVFTYYIEYLDEKCNWVYLDGSTSTHLYNENKQFVLEQARELLEYDE